MRHTKTMSTLVALVVGLWIAPALAHHSLVAEFDISTLTSLRGVVTRVDWVNPHGWIFVDVKRPDGKIENWGVETGSVLRMTRQGLRVTDFLPGTKVVIGGFAAKDGSRTAAGWIVTFPDREVALDDEGGPYQPASFPLGR